MALTTKYRPLLGGSLLNLEGNKTDKISEAAEFDSIAEVETFIENTGSLGEYTLRTYLVKS